VLIARQITHNQIKNTTEIKREEKTDINVNVVMIYTAPSQNMSLLLSPLSPEEYSSHNARSEGQPSDDSDSHQSLTRHLNIDQCP
jgi:hypothetical protein